jgi:hypothetical protein
LKAALEELGFGPCYHMTEVFDHPDHASQWSAAAMGETVDWQELFEGYQASVDWPGCDFYKELMQTYPDAKVVLTVRDPEKWYNSAKSTIDTILHRTHFPFFRPLLRVLLPETLQTIYMIEFFWKKTFKDNFADKKSAIELFNQHIEEVKQYVPAEQLLIYNVKEGWESLCRFLEVEVPKDKPFPHLNDRTKFFFVYLWKGFRHH